MLLSELGMSSSLVYGIITTYASVSLWMDLEAGLSSMELQ